ncbi:MAG: DNA primase, partial [Planctomycetota bacterium]
NNDRDRVLAATDLLSIVGEVVALRPKGREHVGLCPFHNDRTPSLAVVSHKGSGFYKCFACGAAGNAIDFVINYHRMEFVEALKFLAQRAGIELTPFEQRRATPAGEPTRDDILRANALADRFFRRAYADEQLGARARAEVSKRGFEPETVEAFGLGAAPPGDRLVDGVRKALKQAGSDYPSFEAFVQAGVIRPARTGGGHVDLLRDRLVFPICDDLGRPIAFGGRVLDPEQQPKYLNSPESPVFHKSRALYGIHRAKRPIVASKTAIITEGYTDVIACHRAGFTNTVATLGTALTREHARVLRRMCDTVVLLFDGDEAGQKAADRALEVFFAEPIDIKICVLPDELDPDDLLRTEGGRERFQQALDRSVDVLRFMHTRMARQVAGRGLSGRQQMIEQSTARFVDLGLNQMSGVRRQLVFQTLSDLLGISAAELDRLSRSMRARPMAGVRGPDGAESGQHAAAQLDGNHAGVGHAGVGHAGTSSEPHSGRISIGTGASRARREAERRLVAILCCDPSSVGIAVPVEGAGRLPLSEALSPEEITDAGTAELFARIRDARENGRRIGFDALFAELSTPAEKALASDLYLFGSAALAEAARVRIGRTSASDDAPFDPAVAAAETLSAWSDLESVRRREAAKRSVEPSEMASEGRWRDGEARTSSLELDGTPIHGTLSSPPGPRPAPGSDDGASVAAERLARIRARGHDVTAAGALFRRGSMPAAEPGRKDPL